MLSPEIELPRVPVHAGPSPSAWIALLTVLALAIAGSVWFLGGCSRPTVGFDGEAASYCGPVYEDAGASTVSLENTGGTPMLVGFIEVLDEDVSLSEIESADPSGELDWLGNWTVLREVPAGESLDYETILPSGLYAFWVQDIASGEVHLSGRIDTR